MRTYAQAGAGLLLLLGGMTPALCQTVQTEAFDRDPGWDGLNNRSEAFERRTVTQDFGYTPEAKAGEAPGAIGGSLTPDGTPAYYAQIIPTSTYDSPLQASGTIRVDKGPGNALFGFFNTGTINEWRTPNTIVFRINGRGDTFHVHIECATSKWRANAGVIGTYDTVADRMHPIEFPGDSVHTWSLSYDPAGGDGHGMIAATFDDERAEIRLSEELRADGATFNRFGLLSVVKHADSPGSFWLSRLTLNGEAVDLSKDPHWEGFNNRSTYVTDNVRPRFNFGFSPTQHAGGTAAGELGGLFFRGDCRYPEKLAYYGARLDTLTLQKSLRASGKLVLRRAVSDSTTLLGFFHSKHSVEVNESQSHGMPRDVLGFAIEGPSAQGFFVYPVYRVHGDGANGGITPGSRLIYPDGTPHIWALEYTPPADGADARVTLTVDDTTVTMPVNAEHVAAGASFDRFGLVTPWIDGNGQVAYFDDLTFTAKQ